MTRKHKKGIGGTVIRLLLVIPAFLNLTANLFSLMQCEAAMMRKKVTLFFVFGLFALVLLMGSWLCVMAMLLFYLGSLQVSMMTSFVIVLLLNLLLLMMVGLGLMFVKVDPTFPETRKVLQDIVSE